MPDENGFFARYRVRSVNPDMFALEGADDFKVWSILVRDTDKNQLIIDGDNAVKARERFKDFKSEVIWEENSGRIPPVDVSIFDHVTLDDPVEVLDVVATSP